MCGERRCRTGVAGHMRRSVQEPSLLMLFRAGLRSYRGFLTGSDECGLITGVGSRVFHHGMMARRAGERGERMFGVMGEVSVGRG